MMASTSCRCQSLSTVAPLNQVRLSPLAYPQTQICVLCVALGEEVRVQQNTQMKDAICVMVKLEPKYASLSLSLSLLDPIFYHNLRWLQALIANEPTTMRASSVVGSMSICRLPSSIHKGS